MKKFFAFAAALLLCSEGFAQTYTPITLGGFNADVVANGVGSASSTSNNNVDGPSNNYCFVAQGYVNGSNQSPISGLPANGIINSPITPGVSYQLASYSGNNCLRISSIGSGTVTFGTPQAASNVYLLVTGAYGGTATFTVNFSDATTQVFSGITVPKWYNGANYVVKGLCRVNRSTSVIENDTLNPRLYQINLAISPTNTTKTIQSILCNNLTSGANLIVMGATVKVATAPVANDVSVTTINGLNSGCALSNQETISVTVANLSPTSLSNIPVSYKINSGATVNEVIAGPLASNASINYSFTTKANLSAVGNYTIMARTNLTGDLLPANDSIVHNFVLSAPAAVPTVTAGGSTAICSGNLVTLTASSATPGVTYKWYNNSTLISGANSATYSAGAAGSYTAVASLNGCASAASAATNVTVIANPSAPGVNASGSLTICSGDSVALTAVSSASGATFAWFKGGNLIPGATAATYMAKTAGSYTASVTVNGCVSPVSLAQAVTVKQTPQTPVITKNGNLLVSSSTTGNQWYKNGVAISGATVQSLNATSNGTYTVKVTANGCTSAASNAVTIYNTGISADLEKVMLTISPNPSSGIFRIELPKREAFEYTLTDITGKVIRQEKVTSKAVTLDLQKNVKGIYFLNVVAKDGAATYKLILE